MILYMPQLFGFFPAPPSKCPRGLKAARLHSQLQQEPILSHLQPVWGERGVRKKIKYAPSPQKRKKERKRKEIPQQGALCAKHNGSVLPKQMVLHKIMFCWFSLETFLKKFNTTGDFEIIQSGKNSNFNSRRK